MSRASWALLLACVVPNILCMSKNDETSITSLHNLHDISFLIFARYIFSNILLRNHSFLQVFYAAKIHFSTEYRTGNRIFLFILCHLPYRLPNCDIHLRDWRAAAPWLPKVPFWHPWHRAGPSTHRDRCSGCSCTAAGRY